MWRFDRFGRFSEAEGAHAVDDRRRPLALAQLAIKLHGRIAELPHGSSLRRSMAHRTTGGKDVTTVLIEHGCQLHATSNHATCQSQNVTRCEMTSPRANF